MRPLFKVADCQLLIVFSGGGKRARELSGFPFLRALISFIRAPLICPNYLPKISLPNTITLGVRLSTWGHTFSLTHNSEWLGQCPLRSTLYTVTQYKDRHVNSFIEKSRFHGILLSYTI